MPTGRIGHSEGGPAGGLSGWACQAFAAHLLQDGYDIRTVQDLLGHKEVETTVICTHVLNRGGPGVHP